MQIILNKDQTVQTYPKAMLPLRFNLHAFHRRFSPVSPATLLLLVVVYTGKLFPTASGLRSTLCILIYPPFTAAFHPFLQPHYFY